MPNTVARGDIIDRIGPMNEKSFYASPAGTSFGERAIPPSSIGREYHQFEVVKPLPESVSEGKVAPWFEQRGGGLQYKFDKPMTWYVEHGYLRPIE